MPEIGKDVNKFPVGNEKGFSGIRKSRVRTYQYKIDIRGIMNRWMSAEEKGGLVTTTKTAIVRELSKHPVFKNHKCLEAVKRASNEEQLEAALDQVWLQAEARNLVLLA